jgi:DNA adenine methylase
MSVALSTDGPVLASDACAPLVALYQAVRNGWDPPPSLSEEQYRAARHLPDDNPLKAFAGFGCSFGGKWFGGYARSASNQDYAGAARRALLRDARQRTVQLLNFLDVEPYPTATVLYLDPPYAGTTAYGATGAFDNELFRRRVAEWARHTDVFVSEYDFPLGEVVWEGTPVKTLSGGTSGRARERLYYLGPYRTPGLRYALEGA